MAWFGAIQSPPGMSLVDNFAINVRRLRSERDWSQEELAHRAKVSRVYVSYVENRRQIPTLVTLERMAKAFGVEPSILLQRPARTSR
jgi:transcriptional regulator with XRE-family HTH domain